MVLIFIVLLLLFRNYREPVIILLMIPLIFIGVVLGLAVTGKVFNFFSLLGCWGLWELWMFQNAVGMLVEADRPSCGPRAKGPYDALVFATPAKLSVPVAMASGHHDPRHAAPAVRLDVRGDLCAATIMGGLLSRHAADPSASCRVVYGPIFFYNIRESLKPFLLSSYPCCFCLQKRFHDSRIL